MIRSGLVHGYFRYNCATMTHRLVAALTIALLAPVAWPSSGDALPAPAAQADTRAEGLTLDAAVAKVEAKYDARVVRAEEKLEEGRRVYRIRLLSADGRVFDVTVDAASGQVE